MLPRALAKKFRGISNKRPRQSNTTFPLSSGELRGHSEHELIAPPQRSHAIKGPV